MNINEVASTWAKYCLEGKFEDAYKELYGHNCVSLEMAGFPGTERAEGMEAIAQKGEQWNSMVEEFHGVEIIFKVENGKIVQEQFFYPLG